MLPLLVSGSTLGLASGISPGPLMALLIAQTLRYGLREGLRVALAPVFSDLPIVALCLFVLSRVPQQGLLLAWISIIGGIVVAWLGIDALRAPALKSAAPHAAPRSFTKAVLANMLNPHVYLFWIAVGSPILLQGMRAGSGAVFAFVGSFYGCLVGAKILVAVLVSRSREFVTGRGYRVVMRTLGVALCGLAVWMVVTGASGVMGHGAA